MSGNGARTLVGTVGRLAAFTALFLALLWLLSAVVPPTGIGGPAAIAVAAIVAGAVLVRTVDGRSPGALGIAWTPAVPRELGSGIAIGGLALAVVAAVLVAAGLVGYGGDEGTAGLWARVVLADLVVFAVAAFAEEALFRGYAFQVLARAAGPVAATLGLSVLFAAAHARNPNADAFALVNIFLAGVLLSGAYLRTRSLWFATAVHLGWNWTMASLLDLPVSGLAQFDTPLYEPSVVGPAWLTGGAFGPEGGVAGTIAFLLAALAVWKLPGLREAEEMTALRPLVDERSRDGDSEPDSGSSSELRHTGQDSTLK